MTGAENLALALERVRQRIADLEADPLRPDYSIGGQSVSWVAYYKSLLEREAMLVAAQIRAEGPYEIRVVGET